jgi:hypothetical protein
MDAYFLTTARNEEASKLLENFDEIERQDMINLSDHDYQKPALEKLFKKDNVAASKSYQDYLNIYSSQTEVLESKIQSGYSVSIKEQNPHVAIFRGCTGGDCSSQYSFPYPNDPQERVFFIYDEQNKLKGYVSSTMVTDNNGNKALYVITISGNRVNAQDTELILQGLYQNKTALGVDEIILPESSRLGSLLNFSPIRETYTKAIKNGKNVTINYQEQMLRDKIEQYKSENNKGGYDHAKANGNGVAYTPVDKIKLKTEITKAPISKKMITVKSTFEATAVIEFCLALQDSNRSKFIEKTLDLAFDSSEKKRAAVELMNLFKSKQEFTTQEIDDYIRESKNYRHQ